MITDHTNLDIFLRGLILATIAIGLVIIFVRVVGLRAFSKMTNFDFVITIAIGSLIASATNSTEWSAFVQSMTAVASLFFLQVVIARLRKTSPLFKTVIENQPVILMRNGEIFHEALSSSRVCKDDLVAKLREANILDYSEVKAVILETTGDISVLHGAKDCSEKILEGSRNG